jgi:hypothetical protein
VKRKDSDVENGRALMTIKHRSAETQLTESLRRQPKTRYEAMGRLANVSFPELIFAKV